MNELHLPISFGLSVNKTVAKMATNHCKPGGELNVKQPEVQPFLNPLSIRKIPGLGEKTFIKLRVLSEYSYTFGLIRASLYSWSDTGFTLQNN